MRSDSEELRLAAKEIRLGVRSSTLREVLERFRVELGMMKERKGEYTMYDRGFLEGFEEGLCILEDMIDEDLKKGEEDGI